MAPVGVTELQTLVGGVVAACGEAATVALDAVYGVVAPTAASVTGYTQQAVSSGHVTGAKAFGGETSPQDLAWLSAQHGVPLDIQGPDQWRQALASASPTHPVVLGLNNASALGGADAGVQGHYITAFGGGLFSDPNTAASKTGGLVHYSDAQIAAADPFAELLAKAGITAPAQGTTLASGTPLGLPDPTGISHELAKINAGIVDWLKRAGLIAAGGLLLILALVAIFFDQVKDAGTTAAKVGVMAA